MLITIGIDPGKGGGIAYTSKDRTYSEAWPYPKDLKLAADRLRDIVENNEVKCAVVERVSSSPQMGVKSAFSFGQNYGGHLGVLYALRVPIFIVTPNKWQKACLDAGSGETKARSVNMALRLFPHIKFVPPRGRKPNDGMADALHIARFGWTIRY